MKAEFIEDSPEALLKLFTSSSKLLDLRSEVEVERGALPNAINHPILTTSERAAVGTEYAANGSEAAFKLGSALVSGEVKQERINRWLSLVESEDIKASFCWRGGMRSSIAQDWLASAGCQLPRVPGGFKRLRSFLAEELSRQCLKRRKFVVWGMTGCGKTSLLRGYPGFIDLEQLANHRGSAFGGVNSSQPSQVTFENYLAVDLINLSQDLPLVLEAESRLIGRVALPPCICESIEHGEMILVEDTLENRSRRIIAEYIDFLVDNYQLSTTSEGQDPLERLEVFLTSCLDRIRKKLGSERAQKVGSLLKEAINIQRKTNNSQFHAEWISLVLKEYYDPLYNYQLQNKLATCSPLSVPPHELVSTLNHLRLD